MNNLDIYQIKKECSEIKVELSRQLALKEILDEQLSEIENKILEIKTNSTSASELGPLKYLSGLTGVGMDRIINYLLLVIIFVFDPLAIALVIAVAFYYPFSAISHSVKNVLWVFIKFPTTIFMTRAKRL